MHLIFLFVLIYYCNTCILKNCRTFQNSLFDLVHYFSPPALIYYGFVSDFMTIFFLLYTFFQMWKSSKLILFSKSLMKNMMLKLMISALTVLPDPSGICDNKPYAFIMGRCHDLVVSGHASNCFLCYYFCTTYHKRDWWYKYFLWYYTMMTCIWIIISRNHYTIDVVFSYFVSSHVFRGH